ncbi:heavy metal translocating P-type ATPase [Ectobacillus sp. sgz5001026]|uniref:heavy metal translocating P-type ATPase n=1 Tax=Ectobacillus sp. sgz5001026 TaxID=3242473 RepID=UPI0036D27CEB
MSKQEFLLEGLDCANCAAKIEENVKQLSGVTSCSVNFMSRTLTLETTGSDDAVIDKTKTIVRTIEPNVRMKEKYEEMSLLLQGLDCANCASKIEDKVTHLDGVRNVSMNFVDKTLSLQTEIERKQETLARVKKIVAEIEPGVKVMRKAREHKEESMAIPYRLLMGFILFTITFIFSFSEPIKLVLFLFAYVLTGGDVVTKAVKNIVRGKWLDENFLMTIATIGAFAIGQYPEGVAVMLFYQIGEYFQSFAVHRSRKSIASLLDIRPDYANIIKGDGVEKISPSEVQIGDFIIVRPGEKVPLDGKVVDGASFVDTSAITGESIPREVMQGSVLLSGFVNQNGLLTLRVIKEYNDSAVMKILELVQNSGSKKAHAEAFITKFARVYTPFVVIAAALLAIIPPLFIVGASFSDWLYRSLIFLVISCPCALVVSIPLSYFGGIGGASRRGILIKGSNYLEALNRVKYVVFDKTGTLTKGNFKVTNIYAQDSITAERVIEYAALAEVHSHHPIARAIQSFYGKPCNPDLIEQYEEIPGYGAIATMVDGKQIAVGNAKFMNKLNISYNPSMDMGTIVYVAVNAMYAGCITIADEWKDDSKNTVQRLKKIGIKRIVMLTGDAKRVANEVGKGIGIDEIHAELLPHQKVEKVEELETSKLPSEAVLFVGDGINDTPVLARADIGVAMGGIGSDAAIEAADIVIMTDEPSKLPEAIMIAKRTRKIVYENIIFALGVKGIFLLLGAFGYATMWEAVFSDVGVTFLAVLNALRALRV